MSENQRKREEAIWDACSEPGGLTPAITVEEARTYGVVTRLGSGARPPGGWVDRWYWFATGANADDQLKQREKQRNGWRTPADALFGGVGQVLTERKKREEAIMAAYVKSMCGAAEVTPELTVEEARAYGIVACDSEPLGGGTRYWYILGRIRLELQSLTKEWAKYSSRDAALLAGVGEVLTLRELDNATHSDD